MEIQYRHFYLLLVSITISNVTLASNTTAQAWQYIEQKNFTQAQPVLKKQLSKTPNNFEIKFLYARTLAWGKDKNSAIRVLNELIAIQPDNTDLLLTKATVLSGQKKIDEAISTLVHAKNISPRHKKLWGSSFHC